MAKRIHIKIADRGWILERCAREIATRATNVTYSVDPDPSADLQYYINYSARTRRISGIEVGFFTHSENDQNARRRYFDAAQEVEHCVCMSARYADELIEAGIPRDKVSVIAPGVDLEEFQPKIKIGVVGRTYHTGRKGEALVAEVSDVPGIEWQFTGSGWPRPSVHVPDQGMTEFYNGLDYVLVPSLYEGGPMSVLEGLACGIPIISSDVGWVSEYPHIPFRTGDAESLREVLTQLVAERQALRSSVLDRTWSRWAEEHLQLFDRLVGRSQEPTASAPARLRVTLVTHGTESSSIGGPSVRVPRTAAELAEVGVIADMPPEHSDNFDENPIAHVFNVWPADSCLNVLDRAHAVGKRTVLSPIFLNLSNIQFAAKTFPRLFSDIDSDELLEAALAEVAEEIADERNLPIREPFRGFHERVRACVDAADEVIVLSEYEMRSLEYIGAKPRSLSLIRNPVDAVKFASAERTPFVEKFGVEDFVLCVGRIEPRKNQLLLAYAARTLNLPAVFIGHTEDRSYYELVRQTAGENAHFIPRIEPSDPLLKSAFAAAGAFCLPSWAEGAPLAALEAAAAGLPLVLSDRSSEREYFGELAEYINPADVRGLRAALERAISMRGDQDRRAALQKSVADSNSWSKYIQETASVYERLAGSKLDKRKSKASDRIYFDLTTTLHASGNPTGIARVEDRAFDALVSRYGDRIVPILWNGRTQQFSAISASAFASGVTIEDFERLEVEGELLPLSGHHYKGGQIFVVGGAWIRNRQYIAALQAAKNEIGANLTLLVHDLIQMKLKHLYPAGVGEEFESNAQLMCRVADNFLVYSDSSYKDLRDFLAKHSELFKKIGKFRLGDMTDLHLEAVSDEPDEVSAIQQRFSDQKFVLYVSTIEIRKNHGLLLNVWRRLVEERGSRTPHLLFIGRALWRGNEVIDSIERDELLGRYVHVLDDVNDADLDWLYRHCQFTVYPSLYEGWGLPVAESLAYGKVCITSDRTATREIAPNLTDLVDPYDFRAWHDRVRYYLDNSTALDRASEKIRSQYEQRSWDQAVAEIVSLLDAAPLADVAPPIIYSGEMIEFHQGARTDTASRICAGGWGNVEKGGRWSLGERSKLAFRYAATGPELYMRLQLRALARPGQTRAVRLIINKHSHELLELPGLETEIQISIPVRRAKNPSLSIAEIEFEPLELLSPKNIAGSADSRLLGVQLISAQVSDDPTALLPLPGSQRAAAANLELPAPRPAAQLAADIALLQQARDVITLPRRFVGRRPVLRAARALGLDWIWLRMHKRRFRRAYQSISLIIDYLQREKQD